MFENVQNFIVFIFKGLLSILQSSLQHKEFLILIVIIFSLKVYGWWQSWKRKI